MPNKIKRLTPAKLEKLALELLTYLQQKNMFDYVYIYVNGKCYTQHRIESHCEHRETKYGRYYVIPNMPVREIMEYCNPETITVSFDGALYDALNYNHGIVESDLNKMFKKYGMYFEQGYPSDFSLYYND